MNRTYTTLLLAAALQVPTANLTTAQATPTRSPVEIARDLRSGDRDRVAAALAHVPLDFNPSLELEWVFSDGYEAPPEVSSALIAALSREVTLFMDGATILADTRPELAIELIHFVVALRDPASIPVLLRLVGTGGLVRRALLGFGPDIVSELVDVAASPSAAAANVHGALLGLGESVARWGSSFDGETRERIKEVAVLHLDGTPEHYASHTQKSSPLSGAIGLASELRDPDLLERLKSLSESTDLGMDSSWIRQNLRARAAQALRGPLRANRRPDGS